MTKEMIERINYLAKKSREAGLTNEESIEQQSLRQEYIRGFRQGLKNTLDNVYVVDDDGNQKKLEKKK